jgi:urea transporter
VKFFFDSILYSYAQILFSNRRWFGGLLLTATWIEPKLGALGLAGVVLSNLLAYVLRFDEARIRSGFYGFNGILFGAALGYYYELTPFLLAVFPVFIFVTFLITVVLENHFAAVFNLPGLSLPFVLALFITIIFLRNYDGAMVPAVLYARSFPPLHSLPDAISAYFHSLSLILFQPGLAAGILISAGLLIFSRVLFVLSLAGFAASYLFLNWLLPHQADQWLVIAGFNSILTAIALGGSLIIPSRKSALLAVLAVLMVVIFAGFFAQILTAIHLPMLVLSS